MLLENLIKGMNHMFLPTTKRDVIINTDIKHWPLKLSDQQ